MADLTIVAANVVPGAAANITNGVAGVAITAGQTLYLDPTTGTYKLADANSATVAARSVAGIALNSASAGQPIAVQSSGPLTLGATLTPGVAYYASPNNGGICPVADMVTGCYPTILGFAVSASVLQVKLNEAGVSL